MTTTGGRGRGRGTRSVVDFVFANVAEAFDLFGGLEDSVARRASVIFVALGCTLVEVVLKSSVSASNLQSRERRKEMGYSHQSAWHQSGNPYRCHKQLFQRAVPHSMNSIPYQHQNDVHNCPFRNPSQPSPSHQDQHSHPYEIRILAAHLRSKNCECEREG
jgi:hypothetical protein